MKEDGIEEHKLYSQESFAPGTDGIILCSSSSSVPVSVQLAHSALFTGQLDLYSGIFLRNGGLRYDGL